MSRRGNLVSIRQPLSAIAALLTFAVLLAAAFAVGVQPAAAKTPCWKKVVQDWYDNNRIDRVYPPHCYSEALKRLPNDVRTYSSFEEDVKNARQEAVRVRALHTGRPGGGSPRSAQSAGGTSPKSAGKAAAKPDRNLFKAAFDKLSPRNADSVPLPLLILAGLALLLFAAGASGLVARRLKARRLPAPPNL